MLVVGASHKCARAHLRRELRTNFLEDKSGAEQTQKDASWAKKQKLQFLHVIS